MPEPSISFRLVPVLEDFGQFRRVDLGRSGHGELNGRLRVKHRQEPVRDAREAVVPAVAGVHPVRSVVSIFEFKYRDGRVVLTEVVGQNSRLRQVVKQLVGSDPQDAVGKNLDEFEVAGLPGGDRQIGPPNRL